MAYCLYVDGICLKDGKVLLVKRNCEPFKGFWHVVGGQVQEGESLPAALRREFKEEANLNVDIGDMLGWRLEESFDRTKLISFFKVSSFKGEIKLNRENEAYDWFPKFPQHSVYNYSKYIENTQKTVF